MKAKNISRLVFSDSAVRHASDDFEVWCKRHPEVDIVSTSEYSMEGVYNGVINPRFIAIYVDKKQYAKACGLEG